MRSKVEYWFVIGHQCSECGWIVLENGAIEDGSVVSNKSICRRCGSQIMIQHLSVKVTRIIRSSLFNTLIQRKFEVRK